jgi:hypothetical protein
MTSDFSDNNFLPSAPFDFSFFEPDVDSDLDVFRDALREPDDNQEPQIASPPPVVRARTPMQVPQEQNLPLVPMLLAATYVWQIQVRHFDAVRKRLQFETTDLHASSLRMYFKQRAKSFVQLREPCNFSKKIWMRNVKTGRVQPNVTHDTWTLLRRECPKYAQDIFHHIIDSATKLNFVENKMLFNVSQTKFGVRGWFRNDEDAQKLFQDKVILPAQEDASREAEAKMRLGGVDNALQDEEVDDFPEANVPDHEEKKVAVDETNIPEQQQDVPRFIKKLQAWLPLLFPVDVPDLKKNWPDPGGLSAEVDATYYLDVNKKKSSLRTLVLEQTPQRRPDGSVEPPISMHVRETGIVQFNRLSSLEEGRKILQIYYVFLASHAKT